MFGHQDDQHHHHEGDDQPTNDVMSDQAVDHVLQQDTEDNGGTTMQHDDFNPALPPQDHQAPAAHDDHHQEEHHDEPAAAPTPSDNGLLDIRQQALTALSPLVGHLDQAPEEKFRTTMMLIQASDNQDLLGNAFTAAQAIEDEKVRAQALLDVVNEINYFTQQNA